MFGLVFLLTACGTGDVSTSSTGLWDRYIVYYFGQAIKLLSFGKNYGVGIILFTIIIRIILMPLMHYQTKSMRKTQELQPKMKELQEKYASKDAETSRKLQENLEKLTHTTFYQFLRQSLLLQVLN
jgi:YidC/Oxa1 family membrane protein insertase